LCVCVSNIQITHVSQIYSVENNGLINITLNKIKEESYQH